MVHLGQIIATKNSKDRKCDSCKGEIAIKKWYITSIGRGKTGVRFSHRYHTECFAQYMVDRINDRQNNPKSSKHLTSRLKSLTVEQIRRRETILRLLTKDRVRLLRAYENSNPQRVAVVWNRMGVRWAELHQMGVPFKTSLLPRLPNSWTDDDRKLAEFVSNADWKFAQDFREAEVEQKVAMMVTRTGEDDLAPRF